MYASVAYYVINIEVSHPILRLLLEQHRHNGEPTVSLKITLVKCLWQNVHAPVNAQLLDSCMCTFAHALHFRNPLRKSFGRNNEENV